MDCELGWCVVLVKEGVIRDGNCDTIDALSYAERANVVSGQIPNQSGQGEGKQPMSLDRFIQL